METKLWHKSKKDFTITAVKMGEKLVELLVDFISWTANCKCGWQMPLNGVVWREEIGKMRMNFSRCLC